MTQKDYLNGVPFQVPHSQLVLQRVKWESTGDYFVERTDGENSNEDIIESHVVGCGVHLKIYSKGIVLKRFLRFDKMILAPQKKADQ